MPSELKPCPFCGGEPEFYSNDPFDCYQGDLTLHGIRCLSCGAKIEGRSENEVTARWNERAYEATNPGYLVQVRINENVLVRSKSMEDYEKFIKDVCEYAISKFIDHLKRYIDPGQLRSPSERCFSKTDIIRLIDRAHGYYKGGRR